MEQILTSFISTWGYVAIAILILLENILPFIPSEIILTFLWINVSKIRPNNPNIIYYLNYFFFSRFARIILH